MHLSIQVIVFNSNYINHFICSLSCYFKIMNHKSWNHQLVVNEGNRRDISEGPNETTSSRIKTHMSQIQGSATKISICNANDQMSMSKSKYKET